SSAIKPAPLLLLRAAPSTRCRQLCPSPSPHTNTGAHRALASDARPNPLPQSPVLAICPLPIQQCLALRHEQLLYVAQYVRRRHIRHIAPAEEHVNFLVMIPRLIEVRGKGMDITYLLSG